MRLQIAVLLIAAGSLTPPSRVSAQPPSATLRVGAGPAHGDGGKYTSRDIASVSASVDFDWRGPLAGFGFSHYAGTGVQPVYPCARTVDGLACARTPPAFPDVNIGFVDVGWRLAGHGFRADLLLQPSVVFLSRPDIVPLGIGGEATIAHRLVGPVGIELGTGGTYLPSLDGSRVGLRQMTIGVRSW